MSYSKAVAIIVGLTVGLLAAIARAEIHVNDGGTWKQPAEIHVNDGGTWKQAQEVWVNEAGTWEQSYALSTATCQEDIIQAAFNSDAYSYNGMQVGQSFQALHTGPLCEFKLLVNVAEGTPDAQTVRCGTSSDLSSNYYESDNAVTAVTGVESVWTFSSGLPQTIGATYYCATSANSGNWSNRITYRIATDGTTYGNGDLLSSTNSWSMSVVDDDARFKVSTEF